MSEAAPERADQSYDLFVRQGGGGIVWRLKDEGITPEAEQLAYTVNGTLVSRRYDSIATITLSSATAGRSGTLAQCIVLYRNGERLVISTGNAAGLPDRTRLAPFRDFVLDFHQRLLASGADQRIIFLRGMSPTRHTILMVALAAAGLLFFALPLVLVVVTRDIRALFALVAGVGLVWPFWKVADRNRPGSYNPAHPPDLLSG